KTQVGPESGKPGKISESLLFTAWLLPHFDVFLIFPIEILQGKRLASDQCSVCSESRNRFPHDLSTDSLPPIIRVELDAFNEQNIKPHYLVLVQVLYRLIPVIRLGIEQCFITLEDRRIDGIHTLTKDLLHVNP